MIEWLPIITAREDPDRLILVWAPERDGLPSLYGLCQWHPDAGFCIDELREPAYYAVLNPPHALPVPRLPDSDYIDQLDTIVREIIQRAQRDPTSLDDDAIAEYVSILDFIVNGP